MIKYADIPHMTIRELCALAEQVRSATPGSKRAEALSSRMGAAATYLSDSGALNQLLWWDQDAQPEAPPGAQADVIQFPGPRLES